MHTAAYLSLSADSASKPTGAETPADALGKAKRMSTSDADSKESYECPTCGRDHFKSNRGMRMHHARVHDESLSKQECSCENCGQTFNDYKTNDRKYCSQECQIEADLTFSGEEHPQWTGGLVEAVCAECGGVVERHQSKVERYENVYCSKDCQHKSLTGERPDLQKRVWFDCEQCGDEAWKTKSRYERADHHFCSEDCRQGFERSGWYFEGEDHPLHKQRVELECESCGDAYTRRQSSASRSRFCSRSCRSSYVGATTGTKENVNLTCDQCGDGFDVMPHRESTARFCSRECRGCWMAENLTGEAHPLWDGGRASYGEGWNRQKKTCVRIRDQARCQHCGRTEAEHIDMFGQKHDIHHITPAREMNDDAEKNSMGNLVTLCKDGCHQTWETMTPLQPQTAVD